MFRKYTRIAVAMAALVVAIAFTAQAQARAPIPGTHKVLHFPPHVWDGGQWHWPTGSVPGR
jgi:hypothetical protein